MTKVGLLSDTHGYWDEKYLQYFASCDEIWPAADIGTLEVAQALSASAPFYGGRRGSADETHRGLSRQVRSVRTGEHHGAPAQAVCQRPFAYTEGEVRQDIGHAPYQSGRSRHLRLPQGAHYGAFHH